MSTRDDSDKQGLVLDRVMLLGRTFEEYLRYFAIEPADWRGKAILDVASGVGSFCAEANERGWNVRACDPIYELAPADIRARCEPDLDHVVQALQGLSTYRWDFYQTPERLRQYREKAYRTFLDDYERHQGTRYVAGCLPKLPFGEGQFDLALVSYFLFVYEDLFAYEFHRESVLQIMRLTRQEARFYPIVSFEGRRSTYLDRLREDPLLRHLRFEEVRTDFEFLINSNWYLRVTHSPERV
ncbi:MAG TPA: hypothetical protein VNM37_17835 [Candidatus Dormibacteraeota bacterium]|nr:hypothetical protein [Candidatus Dormibacteraeota bacterium]